jgi:hypothetical protein
MIAARLLVRLDMAIYCYLYLRAGYETAKWLLENKHHRAVLLHSAAYESGIKLFKEFPKQTTFGDLNPVIEGTTFKPENIDFIQGRPW